MTVPFSGVKDTSVILTCTTLSKILIVLHDICFHILFIIIQKSTQFVFLEEASFSFRPVTVAGFTANPSTFSL